MIIVVTADKVVELRDSENFRAFKILNEGRLGQPDLAAALKNVATVTEDGANAWVRRTAISTLLPMGPSAAWTASFDKMIEGARKYGWVDGAADTVRAHIETP